MQVSVTDEEIISRFPVGYYQLHPDVTLNFEMNRLWGWVGEERMLEELRSVAPSISGFDDWTREMLELSDKALAADRRLPAAYYARMANFYLKPSDPRSRTLLQPFLDNVEAGNGVTVDNHHLIPYQQAQLSAYRFTPDQPRGTIVVFGGYDTYIAEWLPAGIALRDAGLDTVIFDGPGQGTAADAGIPMTPEWHLPVAAVLDYFNMSGITLMGFSLGGCLVMRAAAREPRVSRVIAFDILTEFREVTAKMVDASGLGAIAASYGQTPVSVVNAAVEAAAKTNLTTQWMFRQGARVTGADTPAGVFKAWDEYHTSDVSPQVHQDALLMAGTKDLGVPLHQLGDQILTLTAAQSITARVFTEAEQAQSHCQIGNTGLAIEVILKWLDAFGGRTAEPASR